MIPPPAPTPPPAPVVEIPAAPTPPIDDSEAKRLAELERLRKEEEAKREARLRSPMLVVNDKEGLASVDPAKVGTVEKDEDPNRRFSPMPNRTSPAPMPSNISAPMLWCPRAI